MHQRVFGRFVALFLVLALLMPWTAIAVHAQDAAALAARQAELQSAIHGARSARGMIVNDQAALSQIRLKPVRLNDGSYMLRAYDTVSGQYTNVSHPTLKAQLRDVMSQRFTTAGEAQASAGAYKGHLTRTANQLEGTYRGRLGGLQNQLNRVEATINQPAPKPVTDSPAAPRNGTATELPKPANDNAPTTTRTTRTARSTGSGGSGAPNPVPETTATGTNATAANGTNAAPKPVTETTATGAGAPKPVANAEVPQSGRVAGEGTSAKPSAPSETTAPASTPAAPTTRMGMIRDAAKSSVKSSVRMIPLMLATGIGVDLANQYRQSGSISVTSAIANTMSTEFVMAMGGSVAGGTVGNVLASVLPGGPFVRAALTIGGAALGANFASGAEIDWGRLAFTTALTAAATLIVPGGIIGLAAVTATGFGADWLYDKLFGKKSTPPAARPPINNTPIPVPYGSPNPNPPPPTQVPTPTPTPTQVVQPPVQNPPPMVPPPAQKPPMTPDKTDPWSDLPVTGGIPPRQY